MIYLDNAATTKPLPSVLKAIKPYMEMEWYNPNSSYKPAQKVRQKIEEVRQQVADEINCNKEEIYFTSGACESNSWVFSKVPCSYKITSTIEHASIKAIIDNNSNIITIPVNKEGVLDLFELEVWLHASTPSCLVSVIMGNNETGTIQDIKAIAELVHKYNGILHTDATQCFGQIPIDVESLGIDLMSASAQKIGGLKGTGFLYVKQGVEIEPLIYGEQENKMRGGTENVVGIVAFGEAIKHIDYSKSNAIKLMRQYFEDKLISELGVTINGDSNKLPNNINFTLKEDVTAETLIKMLDLSNIYVSAGSACNSKEQTPSYVLKAIGLSDKEAYKTLRVTINADTTFEDVDVFIGELKEQIEFLQNLKGDSND